RVAALRQAIGGFNYRSDSRSRSISDHRSQISDPRSQMPPRVLYLRSEIVFVTSIRRLHLTVEPGIDKHQKEFCQGHFGKFRFKIGQWSVVGLYRTYMTYSTYT